MEVILNDELGRMWKKVILKYIKIFCQHLVGKTRKLYMISDILANTNYIHQKYRAGTLTAQPT
jgi:hypothetical protein